MTECPIVVLIINKNVSLGRLCHVWQYLASNLGHLIVWQTVAVTLCEKIRIYDCET